jgi:hypothetical protein
MDSVSEEQVRKA